MRRHPTAGAIRKTTQQGGFLFGLFPQNIQVTGFSGVAVASATNAVHAGNGQVFQTRAGLTTSICTPTVAERVAGVASAAGGIVDFDHP